MLVPLLTRLELETRACQASADEVWCDLLVRDVTEAQYQQLLVRVYGFEAPLEAAFAYTPDIGQMIDLRGRVRAGLIATDLLGLGLPPEQIAALPQQAIVPFADATEALGWLYVADRASLLRDTVRRHLLLRMPWIARATSYLATFDREPMSTSGELAQALERFSWSPPEAARIVIAAQEAFRCSLEWLRRPEPAPGDETAADGEHDEAAEEPNPHGPVRPGRRSARSLHLLV